MIKKAVVTGGAGFIGSAIINKLINNGTHVLILDNLSTGKYENVHPKASFIKIDLSDDKELSLITKLVKDYDVIFHLAAKPQVQPSIIDPILFNKHNVNATLNMLVSAYRGGVRRFIYSASSAAYGNSNILPLTEDLSTSPLSPYGLQKLIGEEYCSLFAKIYGMQTVSLRYFNAFGEKQSSEGAYANVIGKFSKLKRENLELTITNDGEQKRDFVYVEDIAAANILAATSDKISGGEVINIGSGKNISVNQIAKLFNSPIKFIGNTIEPRESLADITKAKELLNWEPKTDVEDWLKNIWIPTL